jgi:hypothetical protein
MDSLSQIVDVVIGVDTHVATHSAAALDARTGGLLAEVTVEATPDGYEALVEFAAEQPGLRAWAIEGTGGHGAGLAARSPTRSTPSAPHAKRSRGPSSARRGPPVSARRCRYCWQPGARRSMQPGSLSSRSSRSSSPPLNSCARSFGESPRAR